MNIEFDLTKEDYFSTIYMYISEKANLEHLI